jgi:aspartyl-tRNA synthetase
MSRGEIDAYTEFVKIYGAKGLAWIKVNDVSKRPRRPQSPIVRTCMTRRLLPTSSTHRRKATGHPCSSAPTNYIVDVASGWLCVRRGRAAASWKPLWVGGLPMFEATKANAGAPCTTVHGAERWP